MKQIWVHLLSAKRCYYNLVCLKISPNTSLSNFPIMSVASVWAITSQSEMQSLGGVEEYCKSSIPEAT